MKCSDETGIPSESFYLAAVSIGSGNDWIKSTGAPNDIEGIADLLVANSFSVQDVIKVEAGKAECYMALLSETAGIAAADVMIIPKLGFFTILKEGIRAFKGTMAESPIFITSRGSVIQVEADKSDIVEVDGEMEGNLPLTISVTGSKINVLAAEGLL